MITGHGGNVFRLASTLGVSINDIADMSSNVNPLGPPPGLAQHLQEAMHAINRLPEPDAETAVAAFSDYYEAPKDRVIMGNGTTQIIYSIPHALKIKKALILGPTYSDYGDACSAAGTQSELITAGESDGFAHGASTVDTAIGDCDAVFICRPNNPSGFMMPRDEVLHLTKQHADKLFIIDESYLPFLASEREETFACEPLPNMIVLNSMSKIFRIPGLRVGFAVFGSSVANKMQMHCQPWSANSLAQEAVVYLMERFDETQEFLKDSRAFVTRERSRLASGLRQHRDVEVYESPASFILVKLPEHVSSATVKEKIAQKRILIRDCSNFIGLSDRFIRVSVKTEKTNQLFLKLFAEAIKRP